MTNYSLSNRKRLKFDLAPYLLVAPAITIIVVILIIPIFNAIKISLTDASLLSYNQSSFVGLDNYFHFISGNTFLKVISATLIYVFGSVALTYVLGLIAALFLENTKKLSFLYRSIVVLPWAVPQVVLVLLWKYMLNPQYGVFNFFLHSLSIIPKNFSWFSDPNLAMVAILLTTLWKQYPLSCLMLLAGMKSISKELYEAASIDGANAFRRFINITLPGLRFVTSGLILLLTIWSFGNFVIIWLMTQGGPADNTAVLTIFTYLNAFKFNKLGYGAAVGVICLVLSLVFSFAYHRFFIRRMEVE